MERHFSVNNNNNKKGSLVSHGRITMFLKGHFQKKRRSSLDDDDDDAVSLDPDGHVF